MTRRRKIASVIFMIILSSGVVSCLALRTLRSQFSVELIADFRLRLNPDGKSEFVELLFLEGLANDESLDIELREHGRGILAYRVANFISDLEAMKNEPKSFRIRETMHLSNEIFEDPEILRSEFLLRTGGLAISGELILFRFYREQLSELGAETAEIDVNQLKIWFERKFEMDFIAVPGCLDGLRAPETLAFFVTNARESECRSS